MRKAIALMIMLLCVVGCKTLTFTPRYATGTATLQSLVDSIYTADSVHYDQFLDVEVLYDTVQLSTPKISIIEKDKRKHILSLIKVDSVRYNYIYRVE